MQVAQLEREEAQLESRGSLSKGVFHVSVLQERIVESCQGLCKVREGFPWKRGYQTAWPGLGCLCD